jgi:transcriptional antiterminator NusG
VTDLNEMRWYVVQAFSGFEKQVQRSLKDHISRNGMEESFGAIEVPTEVVIELKKWSETNQRTEVFPWLRAGSDANER